MSVLRLEHVTRRFGGLMAVDDVSLEIPASGITAIIGPNGAGKTTLFNLISGFDAPTAGQVFFAGGDITAKQPEQIARRGLVRTFQLVQLFDALTVLENVKVGRHMQTRGGLLSALLPYLAARREQKVESDARALLHRTGLSNDAETFAAALPYGRKRLLEIARALAAAPVFLLLDEPAAGLNRDETKRLADLLKSIAISETAVLLIEHDMSLVMNVARRVVVLDFGRIIADGTPEEVRRNPDVIAAYLGTAGAGIA
jgi:branched-chain amino acid transport system ATP-binding protein